jgi:hypothetical protein
MLFPPLDPTPRRWSSGCRLMRIASTGRCVRIRIVSYELT